jgi:hypothetical protein
MNDVVLCGGTTYKYTLKGRLTGKIKTENFTKIQDRRIRMKKIV